MKIVADENIPWVKHYFGRQGEIILKPGRDIVREDLIDADILLVRSVTKVNQALLQNTAVKFVGSATIGFDHLDTQWLDQAKIRWSLAKGSNARAVVEYVVCVIAALQKMNFLMTEKPRAAVIGVGDIGQQVAEVLQLLDFDVVLCDPFRPDLKTIALEKLSDLDLITLHTPLTRSGDHPTYHLLREKFFARQNKNCVLLNTGRGEVVCFEDLKKQGQDLIWCLDVWENEPNIDFAVLESAVIATPHIAGYSVQGKQRGIEMLYLAAIQQNIINDSSSAVLPYPTKEVSFANADVDWRDVVLKIFDPLALTQKMKKRLMENAEEFDQLRKEFNDRYEFGFVKLRDLRLDEHDRLIVKFLFE